MNRNFQFLKFPNCYAVGEMLDWEAPTGGYLLQACLSTAVAAAQNFLESLQKP
jgi:predicted flavoprotein YhiN